MNLKKLYFNTTALLLLTSLPIDALSAAPAENRNFKDRHVHHQIAGHEI